MKISLKKAADGSLSVKVAAPERPISDADEDAIMRKVFEELARQDLVVARHEKAIAMLQVRSSDFIPA